MVRAGIMSIFVAGCARAPAGPVAATPSQLSTEAAIRPPPLRGPYLGEIASDRPTMFARGVVSRPYQELNSAFSPDGSELFYTLAEPSRQSDYTLVRMVRGADGTWSRPEVAPFSGRYADADPIFTADGKRLYFISRRPTTADPAPSKDFDLWYVDKVAGAWGEPVNVGAPVNTPKDELYVSITRDGVLYWSVGGDIHRGVPQPGGTYRVEKLPGAINGDTTSEGDPFVAPDESYLVFMSSGRPDSLGSADLYVSFRERGEWQPARWLGPAINSRFFEYCPIASPDGKYFFFTSYRKRDSGPPTRARTLEEIIAELDGIENGAGNIYWMKSDFLEAMRAGGPPPAATSPR